MPKNILVLAGSPRKNGNSDIMADFFIKAALKHGHTITKYRTANKSFKGCIACNTCWKKGTACSLNDDFVELSKLLENADILVLVSPLYLFGFSSQLKSALDKLNAYDSGHCINPLKIKDTYLLTCGACETDDMFNGITATYKSMVSYMKWENKGIVAIPNLYLKEDIKKTNALQLIEQMASNIL